MTIAELDMNLHSNIKCTGESLRFRDVTFGYENDPFRLQLSLALQTPTRLAILGPNGSGKTTMLKLLGGHLSPSSGSITWGELDLTLVPARLRPTSTVFQDYALFPHYTVRENIEFPLRQRNSLTKSQASEMAATWMERLELKHLSDTVPSQLSPGIKQRVAIARSLAMQPQLLLLDEPSAALDVAQKLQLVMLLSKVFSEGWINSMIIVTHDLDFAFSVADTVAVIDKGRLITYGSSMNLYESPTSAWLARYLQSHNILSGTVTSDLALLFEGATLPIPRSYEAEAPIRDTKMSLLLPTSAIRIQKNHEADDCTYTGVVKAHLFHGPYREVLSEIGATTVRVFVSEDSELPEIGQSLRLSFDLNQGKILPQQPIGE